jgi:hypothetical protein
MSVLHQQRIRVFYNANGFFAPDRPWETFCPACERTVHVTCMDVFATWPEAMAWAETHLRQHHCRYCIDQQMPAGRDDLLGELFERCPACTVPCPDCDGIAVYPADYDTPTQVIHDLATLRLTAVFCDLCGGVVAVVPLHDQGVTP